MSTFIKAMEIWVPSKDQMQLEFCSGSYEGIEEFKLVSEQTRFAYGQGLPGKAWSEGHPLVLNDFEGSYFERIEEAKLVGITAGIAMPIFAGDFLKAVVIFLCGDDEDTAGAIEVWHCDESNSYDLTLMDGYFGTLEHFEFLSMHTSFRKGTGLPGLVWERAMPVIMNDLGKSHRFMRSQDALEAGITTGLGLPVFHEQHQIYIMAFLSARGTPIVRQIEIWLPDMERNNLKFQSGYSEKAIDLNELYKDIYVAKGEGTIGNVFLTGVPSISDDIDEINSDNADEEKFKTMIAIPVIENGRCKCVVSMYS